MDVRAASEGVRTSIGAHDAGPEPEEHEWEGAFEWIYTMRPGTAVR